MRWYVFNIGGRMARLGSMSWETTGWPNRKEQRQLEQKWGGSLVGILLEPCYNHNDYFDPPGGFFWEDEYQAALQQHAEKIGQLQTQAFVECPQCGSHHTAPTRSCRNCKHSVGKS